MSKACPTEGCPFPVDEHYNWCGHQGERVTHLHWPKKGMGGRNPKSKIVALACWPCHDKIDNFGGNIITKDLPGKGLTVWATDVRGNELFEKRLGEAGSAAATEDVAEGSGAQAGAKDDGLKGAAFESSVPPVSNKASDDVAAAPPASPLSPAAEGSAVNDSLDGPVPNGVRSGISVSPSAAGPSVFTEDWSKLSDDELQLKYDTAHEMQGMAFLVRCKAVAAFRDNHVQAWGESWTDHAIERFNVSRRYCFAFANLWEISAGLDTSLVIPLTESRSLMQCIGRRALEDGKAAMEVAVAHHAEYAEPPSVGQLEHGLGEEREPKERHECPLCQQDHVVRAASTGKAT